MLEIWPHLDNYVVFSCPLLEIGLYFGNQVIIFQTHNSLHLKLAHLIWVQNCIIKIKNHYRFLILQQILNELFLLFCQSCSLDEHTAVTCLVKLKEISFILHNMLFFYLLHAILASSLNQLLMLANGFS